jgi:hypothetical protein
MRLLPVCHLIACKRGIRGRGDGFDALEKIKTSYHSGNHAAFV